MKKTLLLIVLFIFPISIFASNTSATNNNHNTIIKEYLSWFNITGYVIEKTLVSKDYKVFSINSSLDEESCNGYGYSKCINLIFKKDTIVYSNLSQKLEADKRCQKELKDKWNCPSGDYPWNGIIYRLTKDWALFTFWFGEWVWCNGWWSDLFTYINFNTLKSLYSVLSRKTIGHSPDPKDDMCENKKTKIIKTTKLNFFKSNNDRNDSTKALNIKAKTTEEAFYKYYKIK